MFPTPEYIQAEVDYRTEQLRRIYPTRRPARRRWSWLRKSA